MKYPLIALLAIAALSSLCSQCLAAGPFHGDYSVTVRGRNHYLDRSPAVRSLSDTTTMKVVQAGDKVTVTFGTFASASAATVLKGKVGNGKICANWWFNGKPHETKVLWGRRSSSGRITGELIYPRTAYRDGFVPGWVHINFTATPKSKKASLKANKRPRPKRVRAVRNRHRARGMRRVKKPKKVKAIDRVRASHLGKVLRARGIDPAVVSLDFSILRRRGQHRGRVRISGVVKNVGSKPFLNKGRPGAAGIQLYQGNRLVRNVTMRDLAPGETQRIHYDRNWNSSSPSEGEFPPSFKLLITYDPDITMDSNEDNDDSNMNNNRIQKSGSEINDLFHN